METNKAIELVEKSEHIALLLPAAPSLDTLAAAEVVGRTLKNMEKHVGLITADGEKKIAPMEQFTALTETGPLTKEFIISLDTAHFPLSELRYEKNEGQSLDIIISPRSSSFEEQAVRFRQGKTICHAILAFGIPDIDAINGSTTYEPTLFTETPLINIDTSPDNKRYGEANIVDPEKTSLSEIAYELVSTLRDGPLDTEEATLILAGIIQRTQRFSYKKTGAETFRVVAELMRLDADLGRAHALANTLRSLPLFQLIGRASVRTKTDERGILWSFATADDFAKTGRSTEDVSPLLEHLTSTFPNQKLTTLLWQHPQEGSIRATLAGSPAILETLARRGTGTFQSPYLLINETFANFRDAETHISELLKEVL